MTIVGRGIVVHEVRRCEDDYLLLRHLYPASEPAPEWSFGPYPPADPWYEASWCELPKGIEQTPGETAREIIDRVAEQYDVPLPGSTATAFITGRQAVVAGAAAQFNQYLDILDAATLATHLWNIDEVEWSWGDGYDAMYALEKALGRTP